MFRKHLVYFYRFAIPAPCNDESYLFDKYRIENSKDNYKDFRRHGVLFIADRLDNKHIHGRLIKIRVGRVRRINVPDGKEWYELVKNSNGIEQEAHVLLSPSDKIMLTEYNSDAFGILPRYVFQYFMDTLDCSSTSMFFSKLMLPDSFAKMLQSKSMNLLKFSVKGDLTEILDELGFSIGNVLAGDEGELPVSLMIRAEYGHRAMLDESAIKKLISKFGRRGVHTRNAVIETEEGYFTLLTNTLLNGEINYDEEADNSDQNVQNQMKSVFETKNEDAKRALEIVEREELDFYGQE